VSGTGRPSRSGNSVPDLATAPSVAAGISAGSVSDATPAALSRRASLVCERASLRFSPRRKATRLRVLSHNTFVLLWALGRSSGAATHPLAPRSRHMHVGDLLPSSGSVSAYPHPPVIPLTHTNGTEHRCILSVCISSTNHKAPGNSRKVWLLCSPRIVRRPHRVSQPRARLPVGTSAAFLYPDLRRAFSAAPTNNKATTIGCALQVPRNPPPVFVYRLTLLNAAATKRGSGV
jgi:hypothetical protein